MIFSRENNIDEIYCEVNSVSPPQLKEIINFSNENKIRANQIWVTKEWTRASFHNARRQSKLKLYKTKEEALASLVKTKKVYIVKSGDTLSRISKRNNVLVPVFTQ